MALRGESRILFNNHPPGGYSNWNGDQATPWKGRARGYPVRWNLQPPRHLGSSWEVATNAFEMAGRQASRQATSGPGCPAGSSSVTEQGDPIDAAAVASSTLSGSGQLAQIADQTTWMDRYPVSLTDWILKLFLSRIYLYIIHREIEEELQKKMSWLYPCSNTHRNWLPCVIFIKKNVVVVVVVFLRDLPIISVKLNV